MLIDDPISMINVSEMFSFAHGEKQNNTNKQNNNNNKDNNNNNKNKYEPIILIGTLTSVQHFN